MKKSIIDTIYSYLMPTFRKKIHKIDLIDGIYPFSISNKIIGKICDGRPQSEYATLYQNLTTKQQKKLAYDLAQFFNLMHQINYKKLDIQESKEIIESWDITSRNDFDIKKAYKTLLPYKIDLNKFKVQQPNLTIGLCHNDLSGSNILLNPEEDDVLVGIVDFGNTIVMSKHQDFFPLYKIDRKLVVDTLAEYNKMTSSTIEQKQTDFMVLAYIAFGLSQSKDTVSPYFMKLLKPFLEE